METYNVLNHAAHDILREKDLDAAVGSEPWNFPALDRKDLPWDYSRFHIKAADAYFMWDDVWDTLGALREFCFRKGMWYRMEFVVKDPIRGDVARGTLERIEV